MIDDHNPNRNEQSIKEFHTALDGVRRMELGLGDLEIAKDDSLPSMGGMEWNIRKWVADTTQGSLEMIDFLSVADDGELRIRITPIGYIPTDKTAPIGYIPTYWHVIVTIEGYNAGVTAVHTSADAALGFIRGVIWGKRMGTDMANSDFPKSGGFGAANEFGFIQFNQVKYDERKE